jgi:hypothetical protein
MTQLMHADEEVKEDQNLKDDKEDANSVKKHGL